ncbi:MAG: MFS transporter [Chlorobiaceae bacterium]|nr:MFS transporter [Chlorobiaceae bacterium]
MKEKILRNKLLLQFMVFSVLGGAGMGVAQMAITLYAVELGATAAQIGLIGGVQGIGLLLTVLPIGLLVDHVGPRRVFVFGAMASALIYLLFPLARSSDNLIWFVALVGFFTAFRFIPMTTAFLEFVRHAGSKKAGWQRGSLSFGLVLLGPLCGASISSYWGLNITFYVVSAAVLLLVFGAPVIFPETERSGSSTTLSENLANLKLFFRDRNILEASGAEALALSTFSCFNAFIVVIAIRVFHFTVQASSLFVSFEGVVFIATLFTFGRVLEKLGQRHFYLVSIAIVIAGLSLLSCMLHPVFLIAGTLLIGIGLGMFNLVNVTRVANANTEKGKSAALFSMFTMLGAIIGPVIGGVAGELLGSWSVFLIFIPLYLLLALVIQFSSELNGSVEILDEGEEQNSAIALNS